MKNKRQQETFRMQFCALKLVLGSLPLVPRYLSDYINLTAAPLETTLCFTALFFLIDILALRLLFAEELAYRKGMSAQKSPPWNGPNAGLYMLGSVVVFFFGVILFGAPVLDSFLETLHLALLLAEVAFVPFCMIYAQPIEEVLKFLQTFEHDMNFDKACLVPGLLAIVGAWCGSIVIPLDWDRPWQKWPIPCCYGAFAGYSLGHLIWFAALWWKSWRRQTYRSGARGD